MPGRGINNRDHWWILEEVYSLAGSAGTVGTGPVSGRGEHAKGAPVLLSFLRRASLRGPAP